jgi:hypothetical protein
MPLPNLGEAMRRRDFIAALGTVVAWPLSASAHRSKSGVDEFCFDEIISLVASRSQVLTKVADPIKMGT